MARSTAFYLSRFAGLVLLLATAALFLFSAISKLYDFQGFIWNIMDAGISNLQLASLLASVFIGLELMLGAFLIAHLYLKKFTYPAIVVLLIFFSLYLVLLIIRQGDDSNCGCFGNALFMTPSQALLKNLALIVLTVILNFIYPVKPYKYASIVATILIFTSLGFPLYLNPPAEPAKPQVVNEPANLKPLYNSSNPENQPPSINLRKGKHIVAFLSLSCRHCRTAAFQLQIIKRQNPELPVYMVLNGKEEQLKDFFQETHAQHVPHILFKGPEEFILMAGNSVPAIFWVNDGLIERKSNIYQLDPEEMSKWLNQ